MARQHSQHRSTQCQTVRTPLMGYHAWLHELSAFGADTSVRIAFQVGASAHATWSAVQQTQCWPVHLPAVPCILVTADKAGCGAGTSRRQMLTLYSHAQGQRGSDSRSSQDVSYTCLFWEVLCAGTSRRQMLTQSRCSRPGGWCLQACEASKC